MIRRAVAALLTLAAAPAAVTAQEVAPEWTSPEHVAADVAAATRRSDRESVQWGSSRRFRGLWIAGFEASEFIEGAATLADARRRSPTRSAIWFEYDDRTEGADRLSAAAKSYAGRVMQVEFEGRMTVGPRIVSPGAPPLGYGHLGGSAREVLVDRVINVRDIGALRDEQSR